MQLAMHTSLMNTRYLPARLRARLAHNSRHSHTYSHPQHMLATCRAMRYAKRRSIHPAMRRCELQRPSTCHNHRPVLIYHAKTCVACAPLRPTPLALTAPGSRRCGACASRDLVADGREAHLEDILVGEGEPRPGAEVVDAEGRPRGVGERVPTGQG